MRWGPRPASRASIVARALLLVLALCALIVPLALLGTGVIDRPRAGIPLLWLAALSALAWLLLWAQPGPFGAWGPEPGRWRTWLRKLAVPLVLLAWVALEAVAEGRLGRQLAQFLWLAVLFAVVTLFQRDGPRTPEEIEAAERREATFAWLGRGAAVAMLVYGIAALWFLWWLLTQWR